jgi:hypothetical protein
MTNLDLKNVDDPSKSGVVSQLFDTPVLLFGLFQLFDGYHEDSKNRTSLHVTHTCPSHQIKNYVLSSQ